MYKLLIFLFLKTTLTIAQSYTPMLADYNEWHLMYCFEENCSPDVYYTDGEMEINGFTYKVLDGYHYISREFLLREDINEQKVYLATIFNNTFREYLLYDFSLEIGDEFEMINPVTPFPEEGGAFVLTDIQSLPLADGNEYKHYYFSPTASNTSSTWDAIWVEGIGSLSIPNAPGGNPSVDSAGRVSCGFRNGTLFYADFDLTETCEATFLKIPSFNKDSNIKVINQLSGLQILSDVNVKRYSLYAINGSKVSNVENIELSNFSIPIDNLKDGIYFLKLETDNGVITKKAIVY